MERRGWFSMEQFNTPTLVLMALAIAINIAVGNTVQNVIKLPIYLDSIGTVLVGVLAGPLAGALTGILANVIWGFTLGPTSMIYPARSLPNIQQQMLTPEFVQNLVRQGQEAGVRNGADFGSPNIADAPSTRVTVGDQSVDVVALGEARPTDPRLSEAQRTARSKLSAYVKKLKDLPTAEGMTKPVAYQPAALAVLARKYVPPQAAEPATKPQAWPGPALPGDMLNTNIGIGCVAATGADKDKVLAAAGSATVITPWTSGGSQWAITFRPLLPEEQGCAALKAVR